MANKCTHEITLLSDVSMQSRLFKDSLEQGIQLNVSIVPVEELEACEGETSVLGCQRRFKIDPLIGVIAEVKLTHPRN